jgi:23S rRNA-/tRNA-specific pseudouridylate synthase
MTTTKTTRTLTTKMLENIFKAAHRQSHDCRCCSGLLLLRDRRHPYYHPTSTSTRLPFEMPSAFTVTRSTRIFHHSSSHDETNNKNIDNSAAATATIFGGEEEEEEPYRRRSSTSVSGTRRKIVQLNVTILDRGLHHIVVEKPPSVVCHHSDWSGSRNRKRLHQQQSGDDIDDGDSHGRDIPMLQRAREAVHARVNLVHRLDRGASGCLLLTYDNAMSKDNDNIADDVVNSSNHSPSQSPSQTIHHQQSTDQRDATAILQQAMTSTSTTMSDDAGGDHGDQLQCRKTYLALVRGECVVNGQDLRQIGWFKVDRPIRNEKGVLKEATTYFRWIAGQDNDNGRLANVRPRASLVLARPVTGRWHQIRKHLNGLSAPIIGDSSHGNSKTNREWRQRWGLRPERTCLHLLNLQLPPINEVILPSGLNVSCPLSPDIQQMIEQYLLPDVIKEAQQELEKEGLNPDLLVSNKTTSHDVFNHEVVTIEMPIEM